MQALLQAISNDKRRKILQLVWDQEMPAREIASNFDVSWPAISQNLRILNDAGLITERREGVSRYYRVDQEAAQPMAILLEQMWADDLARLKQVIEDDLKP